MEVMMSPGRIASPSGMFSTRPTMPTTLTFALRAASACMSPTTQAAPPMSPFISSIPADGLIEIPPESKQTPFPAHCDKAALARRSSSHGEQRVHPQFTHRFLVKRFHGDAELL